MREVCVCVCVCVCLYKIWIIPNLWEKKLHYFSKHTPFRKNFDLVNIEIFKFKMKKKEGKYTYRYSAVTEFFAFFIACGVPSNRILPPWSPPFGPNSTT